MVTSAGTSIPRVLGTGLPRIPEASLFVYVLGVARSIDGRESGITISPSELECFQGRDSWSLANSFGR